MLKGKKKKKIRLKEHSSHGIQVCVRQTFQIIRPGILNNYDSRVKNSNEKVNNLQEEISNISKEMETLRKNQKKMLEMKNTNRNKCV